MGEEVYYKMLIHALEPEKGITVRDYLDALDLSVKGPLQTAHLELVELINALPETEMQRADEFLAIQRSAFMLWEQIDKAVWDSVCKKAK